MRAREAVQMLGGSILIYVIMAACSGAERPGLLGGTSVSEAKADGNASGTRLKVKRYAGADGSSLLVSLHDSQLNVDCGFSTAADGCAPALRDPIGGCVRAAACITRPDGHWPFYREGLSGHTRKLLRGQRSHVLRHLRRRSRDSARDVRARQLDDRPVTRSLVRRWSREEPLSAVRSFSRTPGSSEQSPRRRNA